MMQSIFVIILSNIFIFSCNQDQPKINAQNGLSNSKANQNSINYDPELAQLEGSWGEDHCTILRDIASNRCSLTITQLIISLPDIIEKNTTVFHTRSCDTEADLYKLGCKDDAIGKNNVTYKFQKISLMRSSNSESFLTIKKVFQSNKFIFFKDENGEIAKINKSNFLGKSDWVVNIEANLNDQGSSTYNYIKFFNEEKIGLSAATSISNENTLEKLQKRNFDSQYRKINSNSWKKRTIEATKLLELCSTFDYENNDYSTCKLKCEIQQEDIGRIGSIDLEIPTPCVDPVLTYKKHLCNVFLHQDITSLTVDSFNKIRCTN